ncbi:MAG: hypothetical protein ACOC1O_00245 [bacterium]
MSLISEFEKRNFELNISEEVLNDGIGPYEYLGYRGFNKEKDFIAGDATFYFEGKYSKEEIELFIDQYSIDLEDYVKSEATCIDFEKTSKIEYEYKKEKNVIEIWFLFQGNILTG